MNITYYPDKDTVKQAIGIDDPLLVLVSHDGQEVIASCIDDCGEHHILLRQTGHPDSDLDHFFRIVLNKSGADWTFVCPNDYHGIIDKQRRIAEFYKDGFSVIPSALAALGYLVGINIPTRYRRHFDMLQGQ